MHVCICAFVDEVVVMLCVRVRLRVHVLLTFFKTLNQMFAETHSFIPVPTKSTVFVVQLIQRLKSVTIPFVIAHGCNFYSLLNRGSTVLIS